MNTNKLKTFAKEARIILMEGVTQRLAYWGFDKSGNITEELETIEGGYIFRGEVYNDTTVPQKWSRLKSAIKMHTPKDIIEEAAYTWFNRLIAIKILEKNNYIDSVLAYVSHELQDPIILQKARNGITGTLHSDEKKLLAEILHEDDEASFALLLTAYCRNEKLLKRVFGHIDDYTELLIPANLLSGGGIIKHINTSDAITDEDYKEVELIGWLYQFYISDKKDEVFAGFKNKKKARAEDIPAATQIFTPKWIVKYMVENTVGRIWLDKNPNSQIHNEMKYLVEPADMEAEPTSRSSGKENYKPEPIISDVSELTLLDPACGSGHILVVGFDLLMKMYLEEGYSTRQAVESIINNNIYGLDIDDRATQLANFAILLKAAYYYKEILTSDIEPKIYSMPEPRDFSKQDIYDFLGEVGKEYADELETALNEMQQAKNIGSALKLTLSNEAKDFIEKRNTQHNETTFFNNLKPFIDVIIVLTSKFNSVVANPPYMGRNSMNSDLKNYLQIYYPDSWTDLMTVFMQVFYEMTLTGGIVSAINLPSWMFLSSFGELRRIVLQNMKIESLLDFGRGVFGADFGSVAFSLRKDSVSDTSGIYRRLFLKHVNVEDISLKEKRFFDARFGNFKCVQSEFFKIPSQPIAYWLSDNMKRVFEVGEKIENYADLFQGIITGDNNSHLRFWAELNFQKVTINASTMNEVDLEKKYWLPYNKGGDFRKWYGNQEYVVNWNRQGENFTRGKKAFSDFYLREYISWTYLSASTLATRYFPEGFLWDVAGSGVFAYDRDDLIYFASLIGSKVGISLLNIINPTINYQVENILALPIIFPPKKIIKSEIISLTESNIEISKEEWNIHEISWGFKHNPLIGINNMSNLNKSISNFSLKWSNIFYELNENEMRINILISTVYGLLDEIDSEQNYSDLTILQDETYINEKNELVFKQDVIIQQLLSYSIGCMMGRYRLDKEGLQIAHPNPTAEEIAPYKITSPLNNGTKEVTFEIDDDAIIPLMGNNSPFSDDIYIRVKHFVEVVWGEDTLTENLNFINQSLNMELEKYLTEKFWTYHCKMYKKKPIYWLFSSPNAAFKVLVYIHRMNKFTVQKIRNNYLLKQLSYLHNQIEKLEKNALSLTREDAKLLDKLRADEIECREYDKLLKDYADKQIELDLDDGVTVNYELFTGAVAKIK